MIRDVIAAKNAGADGQCDEKVCILTNELLSDSL